MRWSRGHISPTGDIGERITGFELVCAPRAGAKFCDDAGSRDGVAWCLPRRWRLSCFSPGNTEDPCAGERLGGASEAGSQKFIVRAGGTPGKLWWYTVGIQKDRQDSL